MSLIGKQIGRIRIVDRVGEGAMGQVYVGYDETLERRVAIKMLRRASTGARDQESIPPRGADRRSIATNIAIFTTVEAADADVLVLELLEGQTLRQIPPSETGPGLRLAVAEPLPTRSPAPTSSG